MSTGNPKKIGVYGGSFNPPHPGHVFTALTTLQTTDLDQILVTPCANHPDKDGLVPFVHRMNMCKRAFSHLNNVIVSGIEAGLPKPSYTVQTLKELKKGYSNLYYIVGTDLAEEIPNWENADGLTDLATLMIVPRQGHPLVDPPEELGDFILADFSFQIPEVSSSLIRSVLQRGGDLDAFLDNQVISYIQEHELYHDQK
jgi:nicotinate-nucleotide adenylyltransferase